jgi:hypothetical protein
MPGLIRGVARVAAVAGTATAVSNRVSRRQAGRWSQQEEAADQQQQAAAPPVPQQAAAPAGVDVNQLKELAQLHDQGVLTDAEFQTQKARLLGS